MQKISEAGFEGVELWGGQFHGYPIDFLAHGSNISERKIDNKRIGFVSGIARRSGLDMVCYTPEQYLYPLNYLAGDIAPFDEGTNKQNCLDYFKLCIDVAKKLGTRNVLIATPYWLWKKDKEGHKPMSKAEIFERVTEYIRDLTTYAERSGMNLMLEALPHIGIPTAVETLDDTVEMLRRIDSRNLRVIIDTGHLNVTATKIGRDPTVYLIEHVKGLSDKLAHVHIDDNRGNIDSHLAPGEGGIDFKPLLVALDQIGYTGYLSLELNISGPYSIPPEPERLIKKSREFLIDLMS
jgi:sugar phosphate isomerase/epimerase